MTFIDSFPIMQSIALLLLAGFAGFVDAVVGGGGLIQIPGLFSIFPSWQPATVFGTNKLASITGTSVAVYRFIQKITFSWRLLLPACLTALLCSFLGARLVALLPVAFMRPFILLMIIVVAVYTFAKKEFGLQAQASLSTNMLMITGALIGAILGFYDGIFGPGTGAFLIFALVRFAKMDFMTASAHAKVVNWVTNASALTYFVSQGHIVWPIALLMATANFTGAAIGTKMALTQGSEFVRKIFLFVLVLLIGKFGYDTIRLL
jgi:uncharacterized membrane protein YfcA